MKGRERALPVFSKTNSSGEGVKFISKVSFSEKERVRGCHNGQGKSATCTLRTSKLISWYLGEIWSQPVNSVSWLKFHRSM